MEMFLKEHFWLVSPLISVRLFAALLLLHPRPSIFQCNCAVEDRLPGLRIGIDAEVSQALELVAASGGGVRERGFQLGMRDHFAASSDSGSR